MSNKSFGCYNNGFTITFDNGLTLSTRFGKFNYCENKSDDFESVVADMDQKLMGFELTSSDCEVAIIREDGEFAVGKDGDTVKGWVKFNEWLEIFDWCRNYKG